MEKDLDYSFGTLTYALTKTQPRVDWVNYMNFIGVVIVVAI